MQLLPAFVGSVKERLLQEAVVVGDYLFLYAAGALSVACKAYFWRRVEDEQAAVVAGLAGLGA